MASLDVLPAPRPSDVASPPPSSRSRLAHARQMSSLSMNTFTTTSQSHYPSEPLLRDAERMEQPPSRPPLHPDPSSSQTKGYWERSNARRVRRLRLLQGILLSIMGSWASYTTVRYFIAYRVYPSTARRSVALPLGICSLLSLLFVMALAMSFILPYHTARPHPPLGISPHHALQFLLSFFLFAPTVVNLVFVCVWRRTGSGLSLRGRCHWNLDVVWVGVGGQCVPHAPPWGVWLTAAILRLVITAFVLFVYYFASKCYRAVRWPPSYHPDDVRKMDPVEISQIPQADAPSRPSPVLHPFVHKSSELPQRSLSSGRMAVIPEINDTPNRERNEQGNTEADSATSSTLSEEGSNHRSAESGASPPKSLRRTKSSRDVHAASASASSSSRHAALVSSLGEGELQGFAEQFRALVDQVSRELEEGRLEDSRESRTPPLHHVLDTHTPYMTIDEFGREVPSEEAIAILGGVIKRMPTIESMGSRELGSLRSATLVSGTGGGGGVGSASVATSSSASSRPPTGATFNDAASISQPSSRSNSIHRLRTPSELGELVRDALRARGQSRPLPARPGSGGSISGSGCGTGESVVGPTSRSRSNSLGPNEVLPPVTEHGELGREDLPPPRPPRRFPGGDMPEQHLLASASVGAGAGGGIVNTNEMGEVLRAEWSRSWASSSPSATSTYFTAGTGTSGSLVGGGGGGGGSGSGSGGGETGTGGSGGGPPIPRK